MMVVRADESIYFIGNHNLVRRYDKLSSVVTRLLLIPKKVTLHNIRIVMF